MWILLFIATLLLAYANGANDNFKGVATLYGSGTLSYRSALWLATVATFTGSICSLFLAQTLVANFSGKGVVPIDIAGSPVFLLSVAVGAGLTVLLATRYGFPISTTHSLVGAIVGSGLIVVGTQINTQALTRTFLMPLLLSPLIAIVLSATLYSLFSRLSELLGLTKESCVCVGHAKQLVPVRVFSDQSAMVADQILSLDKINEIQLQIADEEQCVQLYTNQFLGRRLQSLLDYAHIGSAMAVSFARGLNDTPKIAGLIIAAHALNLELGMIAIATAMALGGWLQARRVAETMSHKITHLSHGQGFSANLMTSLLVILASRMGLPVSTTHVSVGALFGIGLISQTRDAHMMRQILLSWVITLPTALVISALAGILIQMF